MVSTFFSRNAGVVIGVLLLLIIIWVIYSLGPTALGRWFG
jgi:hypothetical protein